VAPPACGSSPPDRAQPPDGFEDGWAKTVLHASCVAHCGRAVLIRGASGCGKSGLALRLMALGATLVADDRTVLWRAGAALMADAPAALRGQIEAREVGILRAQPNGPTPVALVIDMDRSETARLPARRSLRLVGFDLALVRNSGMEHFPAAIMTYLSGGREA